MFGLAVSRGNNGRAAHVALLMAGLTLSCGNEQPVAGGTGGAATGGAASGTGGAASSSGGQTAGGTGTGGGATSGGQATGGTSSGGNASGGTGTGGTSGGQATGGTSSGGKASGGTGTGGVTTGGTSAGGSATGGASGGCSALETRITTASITTPEGAKPGVSNYRIWGRSSLNIAPVFTIPLANCGSLVCYTTGTSSGTSGTRTARVAVLDANDQLVRMLSLGAYECRGLAAEADGHFAVLLWQPGSASTCADYTTNGRLWINRYDLAGTQSWSTELINNGTGGGTNLNCPTDWVLGEARLEFGGSRYGAYYHVHSSSGHEGDTLKYVDLTGVQTTQWGWGCSHSMSNLLRYSTAVARFMPACVTDCFPGTSTASTDYSTTSLGGIYLNNRNKVIDVDAGCNGNVAGELGGAALSPTGWKIVYNAHQAAATLGQSSYSTSSMNQDIGFASVAWSSNAFAASNIVWLTSTASINEADSGIERWQPACDSTEQYVVGWSEPGTSYKYKLARVNASGSVLEGPTDVTTIAKWGRRDDPFRQHYNQDIVWSWFDSSGGTTLRFARLRSGGTYQCAAF
jgi:hypothetical protein